MCKPNKSFPPQAALVMVLTRAAEGKVEPPAPEPPTLCPDRGAAQTPSSALSMHGLVLKSTMRYFADDANERSRLENKCTEWQSEDWMEKALLLFMKPADRSRE